MTRCFTMFHNVRYKDHFTNKVNFYCYNPLIVFKAADNFKCRHRYNNFCHNLFSVIFPFIVDVNFCTTEVKAQLVEVQKNVFFKANICCFVFKSWSLFVIEVIKQSRIKIRWSTYSFLKKILSEPTPSDEDQNALSLSVSKDILESGALDRSAILTCYEIQDFRKSD